MASQALDSSYQRLVLTREEGYAIITLNRPPVNAIDSATLAELGRALDEIESDKTIRSVIVTGSGDRMFSAGADVTEFATATAEEQERFRLEVTSSQERAEGKSLPSLAALIVMATLATGG